MNLLNAFKTTSSLLIAAGLCTTVASGDTTVIGVDLGCSGNAGGNTYTGEFDGTSGFIGLDIPDSGQLASPSADLGNGVTLTFTNTSGWNDSCNDTSNECSLLDDHLFAGGAFGSDNPGTFEISGVLATDTVILECVEKPDRAMSATFGGSTNIVNSDGAGFVFVGLATGATSHSGSWGSEGDGFGEGNMAGMRITIISGSGGGSCSGDLSGDGEVAGADIGLMLSAWGGSGPEDLNNDGSVDGADIGLLLSQWGPCTGGGDPTGECCINDACYNYSEANCLAAGGAYGGDDSECTSESCIPPGPGPCCEANVAGVPNCLDIACANVVCHDNPDCCEVAWDANCAALAVDRCNSCDGSVDRLVAGIDLGMSQTDNCGNSPVHTGTFDGHTGFLDMSISACGSVESPSIDIGGGVTLQFNNVTGWNNTDGVGPDSPQALTGDHFFSNWEGSGPVNFTVTGMNPCDTLILEFTDRRGGEKALVTFDGVTTLVDAVPDGNGDGLFTDVSNGGVTGQTSYAGSFTGENGDGEGNLSGVRMVVLPGDPNCGGGGKDNFNCDEVHGGAGCNDGVCEAAVCNIDPVCCESVWDQACVNLALSNCKTP